MKITISLITTAFISALVSMAWGQPGELLISKGPKTGNRVKLTKEEANPELGLISRTQTNGGAVINPGGSKSGVQVKLMAHRYAVVRVGSDGKERHARVIEFEVLSITNTPFHWSCWVSGQPRDFAVFTTESGKTYACYTGDGVHIFRVDGSKESEVSWREYWEYVPEENPDAVKLLTMGVLFKHFGEEPFASKNALYYDVFVDNIFEVAGELRVTLHGNKLEPKYTFALRSDKWELVSK